MPGADPVRRRVRCGAPTGPPPVFVAGYAPIDPSSSPMRRASASSPREARGDELGRDAGLGRRRVRADGDGRGVGPGGEELAQAREQLDGPEVVDRRRAGCRRGRGAGPCPRRSRGRRANRPRGRRRRRWRLGDRRRVTRSATTSVSRWSTPMTRCPSASRRALVAAPIPEAAPVIAIVRMELLVPNPSDRGGTSGP